MRLVSVNAALMLSEYEGRVSQLMPEYLNKDAKGVSI